MKKIIDIRKFPTIIATTILWACLDAACADDPPATPAAPAAPASDVVIRSVELGGKKNQTTEVTWLGLAVGEASEALSSQLGLKHGEGLTVSMIAQGSPAEKAGFQKNDVLVELDGQMLVLPLQLRKLVQMHAEGDSVKLTFYRGGKKQAITVKLGKTKWEEPSDMEDSSSPDGLQNFRFQLKGLDGQLRGLDGQLRGVGESLARVGLDKDKVDVEIKRTMTQTRKAIQDALQRATVDRKSLVSAERELESLARGGVDVDKEATVIVRDKHNSSRTAVQTDDTGSYVIEAGAKTRLTARGHDGKLLFEGEIDTPEQRIKVPKEVWEKVKPMLDQINAPADHTTEQNSKDGEKPNL